MDVRIQHFACTQCGRCCDRSPEVELSEAAGLADVFVFRLMFRMHWLADHPPDSEGVGAAAFWERRRLLATFAAHKSPVRLQRNRRMVGGTRYLMISAVTVDSSPGACSALTGTMCGIHERRPLSCRTVPLHYSRGELAADSDLATFAQSDGYACDISDAAEQVLADGRIISPAYRAARDEAAALAIRDRPWSAAIVRGMKRGSIVDLPTLADVEASAGFAAPTVPMALACKLRRRRAFFKAPNTTGSSACSFTRSTAPCHRAACRTTHGDCSSTCAAIMTSG